MKPTISEIFGSSFLYKDGTYRNEISQKEIDLLFEHRLLKTFLPEELNGLGLSLTETLEIIREASFMNGSLGWLIQIGNGGNYFASCFEIELSKKWFTDAHSVIAGSGSVSGIAKSVSNGFIINGTWAYCSGADYATLFTITFQDPESGERKAAIIPRRDVQVLNDWKTIGLKHTSTHSISLKDVFVPNEQVFDVQEQKWLKEHPSFSVPFVIYAQAFFLQVVFGITDRILDESDRFLQTKRTHWKTAFPGKMNRTDELMNRIRFSLDTYGKRTVEITEQYQQEEDRSSEERHRTELVHYAKNIRNYVHELVGELGITVIYENHPISIFYLDLIVAGQHYLLRED